MSTAATTSIGALSTWLYHARVARGLSQESLALLAGISVPTYGRIERAGLKGSLGRVSLDTFLRLVAVLQPSEQELLDLLVSVTADDLRAR